LTGRAGTKGYMVIVPVEDGTLQVSGRPETEGADQQAGEGAAPNSEEAEGIPAASGSKRPADEAQSEPAAKRHKAEEGASIKAGKGDIFLCDGVRDALRQELSASPLSTAPKYLKLTISLRNKPNCPSPS
jgi:hypothetical protein